MAACCMAAGADAAGALPGLIGEHPRPATQQELQQREPLRGLCEALAEAVEGGAASVSAGTAEREAERLLQQARKRLEEHLDEVSPGASQESWGAIAPEEPRGSSHGAAQAVLRLLHANVPSMLVASLGAFSFEARKDATRLFNVVLRLGMLLGIDDQVAGYVKNRQRTLQSLLQGCGSAEVALQSAQILRSCTRSPQLVAALMEEEEAPIKLLGLVQHQNFDIASEAFHSLQELLLVHKRLSTEYLEVHFEEFFAALHALLFGEEYVRKRQALRLLGDVLLDRAFMGVMVRYVRNERFLQIHMNLLRHSSKQVRTDAFHVFKAFVGNPSKPHRVQQILYQNREKLVQHLATFHSRREADDTFKDDIKAVICLIQSLEAPRKMSKSTSSTSGSPRTSTKTGSSSLGPQLQVEGGEAAAPYA